MTKRWLIQLALLLLLAVLFATCSQPNGSASASALCPAQEASGSGTYSGNEGAPIPQVYGKVAKLSSVGPPLKFDPTTLEVEARSVHYRGTVIGDFVQPSAGGIKELFVSGKPLTLESSALGSGCLDTKELGRVRVLFKNSMMNEEITLVLSGEQIKKLE